MENPINNLIKKFKENKKKPGFWFLFLIILGLIKFFGVIWVLVYIIP